jgi:RNA 3'-terminal phosphate cyclase
MYGGTSIESSPSGPLICTVDIACVLVPLPFAEDSITLTVTPCGTESGKDPIFDLHDEVVVKVLEAGTLANAGNRKVGIESDCDIEGCDAHCAHRRRAGANMVLMLVMHQLASESSLHRNAGAGNSVLVIESHMIARLPQLHRTSSSLTSSVTTTPPRNSPACMVDLLYQIAVYCLLIISTSMSR